MQASEALQEKATLLMESRHFVSVGPGRMQDKQLVFLALCNKKPVSQALSVIWDGLYTKPDDEDSLAKLLTKLGLRYSLHSQSHGTNVTVSHSQELIKSFIGTRDDQELGKLLGFPQSAIEAYGTEDMLPMEEQDNLMAAAGLPIGMPQFCMSRTHAEEELRILQDWYLTLELYHVV